MESLLGPIEWKFVVETLRSACKRKGLQCLYLHLFCLYVIDYRAVVWVASQIPRLLQAEADDGVQALCQAAEAGHVSVIHALLDAGVSGTATASSGTALHFAAQGGHVAVMKALQSRGLRDMEKPNDKGVTPAAFAASKGHLDVVKFLQSSGCNMETAQCDGGPSKGSRAEHVFPGP